MCPLGTEWNLSAERSQPHLSGSYLGRGLHAKEQFGGDLKT